MPDDERQLLDALRDHYRKPRRNLAINAGDNPPDVPRPGIFMPDPFVIGPPEIVKLATKLMDENPHVKQNVKSITAGPTNISMRDMLASGLEADEFQGTNLSGIYGKINKDIGINPGFMGEHINPSERPHLIDHQKKTLAHELAHAAGYEELGASQTETIYDQVMRRKLK